MSASVENPKNVEFYFDAICPWCWMTSRWAAEVAEARGFTIDWKPISLAIINEANGSGDHAEAHGAGKRMGLVALAVGDAHGDEGIGKLYTALGERLHPEGRRDYDAIMTDALEELGYAAELAEAADSADDAVLRSNTEHALAIAGPDVGVPIISIDGVAFFGPVVTPAPTGEDALRLWDGIFAAASVPGFYELKRGRTSGPQF